VNHWVSLPGGALVAVSDRAWEAAWRSHPLDAASVPRRSLALDATAWREERQAQFEGLRGISTIQP
jgi:hypothetical protein